MTEKIENPKLKENEDFNYRIGNLEFDEMSGEDMVRWIKYFFNISEEDLK